MEHRCCSNDIDGASMSFGPALRDGAVGWDGLAGQVEVRGAVGGSGAVGARGLGVGARGVAGGLGESGAFGVERPSPMTIVWRRLQPSGPRTATSNAPRMGLGTPSQMSAAPAGPNSRQTMPMPPAAGRMPTCQRGDARPPGPAAGGEKGILVREVTGAGRRGLRRRGSSSARRRWRTSRRSSRRSPRSWPRSASAESR
jgi:hypothetical protein